jgi:hypothetical protein
MEGGAAALEHDIAGGRPSPRLATRGLAARARSEGAAVHLTAAFTANSICPGRLRNPSSLPGPPAATSGGVTAWPGWPRTEAVPSVQPASRARLGWRSRQSGRTPRKRARPAGGWMAVRLHLLPTGDRRSLYEERLFRVLEPAIRSDNVFSIKPPFCPPYAPGWFE